MNLKHGFYLGSLGLAAASFASNAFAQSPPPTFAGPYVGAFGGYGWGHSSQHDNFCAAHPFGSTFCENGPVVTPDMPGAADGSFGLGGALGGGLVGYNFDYNQFVFGIEGDGAVMDLTGKSFNCGFIPHECGTKIHAGGDLRLRVGIPFGQFMPYIAGGLAIADISAFDNLFGTSGSSTRAGWTIGGGVEYKVTPMIGLRVEYLYSQFNTGSVFDIAPGFPEQVSATTNVVRGGVTFYFNPPPPPPPPVVAKY